MFKKLAPIICGVFFLASELAFAFSCETPNPESIVENYDTVFVAFITEGHFVEGGKTEHCGWIEGSFEVAEELKGNPDSVTVIRKRLTNCKSGFNPDPYPRFPIGKYILVETNNEVAHFDACASAWDDFESSCLVDAIKRHLNIDETNAETREWCVRDEQLEGKLSRIKALREYIDYLENEREAIDTELKEMKRELSESELLEEQL